MLSTLVALCAQVAAFLALLLAVSAIHKASAWSRSLGVVRQFGGVPSSLSGTALGGIIVGELAAAALLIAPAYRAMGAVVAAGVWTLYLALIVRAIVQNRRDADCGCSFGPTARPLGAFQVGRNILLAGLAAGVAGTSAIGGTVPVQMSQVLGAAALLALYGALDQVMALRPLRSGEVL